MPRTFPRSEGIGGETPPSDRGRATFGLVLQTSTELFAEKGFHGASMRELAERGGLVPSAFYYYFESKYAVLLAIIEAAVEGLWEEAVRVPDDLPAAERLQGLLEGHTRVHLRGSQMARVYDREIGELEEEDFRRIHARLDAYEQLFRSTIEAGAEAGCFAADTDVRVATKSILVMATGAMEWWSPDGRLSAAEVSQVVADYGVKIVAAPVPLWYVSEG